MDDSSDLSDDELSTPPSSDDDATDDGEIHEVPAKKPRSPLKKEPPGTKRQTCAGRWGTWHPTGARMAR